jgi:hypothetical protein
VRDLREAAAVALGTLAQKVALVPLTGPSAGKELMEDGSTLGACNVTSRDIVCAEIRASGDSSLEVVDLFERVLNTLHIKFNHPDRPLQVDENSIAISKSQTVAELKNCIAKELGLDSCLLHLRRSRAAPQMKDQTKTLREANISDNDHVFVGHGAPCGADEILLQIAFYSREKGSQKVIDLFEQPVKCTSSVRSLREALVEPLMKMKRSDHAEVARLPEEVVWQKLRLRDGQPTRQYVVLRDDRTLRSALPGLSDGRQLAVQFLDSDEMLGQDDVIISVRPWRVLEGRLHAPTELVVNKAHTLADFHSVLASRFSGLLQKAVQGTHQEPEELDSLQIVVLPGASGGPPLTSQRCAALKWAESRLNFANGQESSSLADFREFRDGAAFVVRSRLAAVASECVATSDAKDVQTPADGKSLPRPTAKSAIRKPPTFTLAAPARKERSLHIEVLCPDGGNDACMAEVQNS